MQYLSEKKQGKCPSAQAGSRSRFETGPSQTRSNYINHSTEKVSKAHMEHGEFYQRSAPTVEHDGSGTASVKLALSV